MDFSLFHKTIFLLQAQFIAQSIGQAFQVAYVEFLKANGIEDHSFVKEMDYQEVLNSQEIFGNELALFAKKELQKEVINLSIPGLPPRKQATRKLLREKESDGQDYSIIF